MKHIFVKITHMYDGLEFPDKGVYTIPDGTEPVTWAMENVAKTYLDDLDENHDPINNPNKSMSNWYSFAGGQHFIKIESATIISKDEFLFLRNYV